MGVWISAKSAATRHGVYAISATPPKTIQAIGTGVAAIVGQFPWGPSQTLTTPASTKEMLQMFAPEGSTRTSGGYLSLINKGFPTLKIVRVLGSDAVIAHGHLVDGATEIVKVTLKYPGTLGNSVTAAITTASDGDANHFNLDVSLTGTSGTTTDSFKNLNYSATGTHSAPSFTDKVLVGAITSVNNGRPDNATGVTFSAGSDGTVSAASYVGTAGTGNLGIALLEGDSEVRAVFVDDCGSSYRATVNAGLQAHATLMGDRLAYINGNSGMTLASTIVDKANYVSNERVVYVDPWVYAYDDVTGAEQLCEPSSFVASVACQVSPSTSVAWKDSEVGAMLGGVVRLQNDRGQGAATNTAAGVCTIVSEQNGGHRIEAGVLTCANITPANKNITRTRMGDYIANSFVRSSRGLVDSPNVEENQVIEVATLQKFLDGLKAAAKSDPNHSPHIVDYSIGDLSAYNSANDLANGEFTIPASVQLSSAQEKIFLLLQYGEGVTVTTA
jgi:phage tail sheath protein FI